MDTRTVGCDWSRFFNYDFGAVSGLRVTALTPDQVTLSWDTAPITVVSNDVELKTALLAGGSISLLPGTYVGNFVISRPNTYLIGGVALPPRRVILGETAGVVLSPADPFKPTLTVRTSNVLVRGLTCAQGRADRPVVVVGSSTATDPLMQPDNVIFDRIEVHANLGTGKRGVEVHSRGFSMVQSLVTGYLLQWQDSQAFYACNGPGPYSLLDNQFQGSGENVLFGGDRHRSAGMVPGNILVRGNLLDKPQAWRAYKGSVKNSFELKAARGCVFEDNIIDGCWLDAQAGHMIVLTPRNQYGDSPWVVVEDVVIRRNRSINHTNGYAVNTMLTDNNHPTMNTRRITVEGNLFQDSVKGILTQSGIEDYLIVRDNTMPGIRWNLMLMDGGILPTALTWERNVTKSGDYGIMGKGMSPGVPSLNAHTPGYVWAGNVMEKTAARVIPWPTGTTVLPVGGLAPLLDADYHYIPGGAGW